MSTLEALSGWDYRVVSRALQQMRQARNSEARRAILQALEDDNPPNGSELRAIAESEFKVEWDEKREVARG